MKAYIKYSILAAVVGVSTTFAADDSAAPGLPEATAVTDTEPGSTAGLDTTQPNGQVPNQERESADFATTIPDAVGRFETALGIGAQTDNVLVKDLEKVLGMDSSIAGRRNKVEQLQQQLNDLENTPTPPEPEPLANQNPNAGQGSGGGSGGGGSGGGSGGGNQPPEMASIPQSSGFTLPENPSEVTPDFASGFDGGSDRGSTFNPSSSSIGGYTPPALDLSKPANNGSAPGQFGPAQIAAGDMPKLKTLDSAANPGTGAGAGGDNAGGAGGAGGPSGMGGGAPSGGGGGDSQFGNLGYDGGGEGGSGINIRDAGWGSGGEGGSSGEASNGGNGSDVAEKSSKKFPMNQLMDRKPSDQGRFLVRSKSDGSVDDSIFGKLSFWVQDSCGFVPNSKAENKPGYCDKAIENDLQLAYSEGGLSRPQEPETVATAKQFEPLPVRKPRAVKKGLREIASTPRSAEEVASESEDLLEALRARAGNI